VNRNISHCDFPPVVDSSVIFPSVARRIPPQRHPPWLGAPLFLSASEQECQTLLLVHFQSIVDVPSGQSQSIVPVSDANCDVAQESDSIWNIDLLGSMEVARGVTASPYINRKFKNRVAMDYTHRFAPACVLSVDGLARVEEQPGI
jgi:hypothetical protein